MQKNWNYPTPNTLPLGGLGHIVDTTEGSTLPHIYTKLNPHLSANAHIYMVHRNTYAHILYVPVHTEFTIAQTHCDLK